jgi:putative addiction module killer protein
MRYHSKAAAEDIQVREFTDVSGRSPFARWFNRLNSTAAAKVTVALYRIARGNFSNVKSVGQGVYEFKINFGPGYRIYFGKDSDRVVILLGGQPQKEPGRSDL